ncbi:PP2C family protein-serine/threonine phosphatase [Streptomyces sp. NPDC005811]|uniref:PP2C family protein-serine/threonine phosphatase n=1 Tax=Streptomyces sp. NPDC005811 TaxID=3154565 RepID=UPI0034106581
MERDTRPAQARRRDVLQRHQLLQVRGRSVTWLVPLVVLVAISYADYHSTGEFRIVSWCVFVSAIAAALCGVWTTALFAVLSLVVYVTSDAAWPVEYREGPADFVLVLVGGVLSVLAASVRVRVERRMLHMMDIAETTRRTVLRPLPPVFGGIDHAAVYLAADADARVGGDFYDIQPGPHGTRVLLGDVQGKGLGAVEAAAALLGTFREAAYHEPDLTVVAARLETRMRRHRLHTVALGRDDGDRFATAVLIGFPAREEGVVEVVGFGHEPPLVVSAAGVRPLPCGEGLPLGLGDLTAPGTGLPGGIADFAAAGAAALGLWDVAVAGAGSPVLRVPVAAEETLLLVTDGVTEARDAAGEFYPLTEEVRRAVLRDPRTARPERLVTFVREGTLRHCRGRLADDTTIFAVRRTGPKAP